MKAYKLSAGQIVEREDWNDGKPVRIESASVARFGVGVRYVDPSGYKKAQQTIVKPGEKVTHKSGSNRQGKR